MSYQDAIEQNSFDRQQVLQLFQAEQNTAMTQQGFQALLEGLCVPLAPDALYLDKLLQTSITSHYTPQQLDYKLDQPDAGAIRVSRLERLNPKAAARRRQRQMRDIQKKAAAQTAAANGQCQTAGAAGAANTAVNAPVQSVDAVTAQVNSPTLTANAATAVNNSPDQTAGAAGAANTAVNAPVQSVDAVTAQVNSPALAANAATAVNNSPDQTADAAGAANTAVNTPVQTASAATVPASSPAQAANAATAPASKKQALTSKERNALKRTTHFCRECWFELNKKAPLQAALKIAGYTSVNQWVNAMSDRLIGNPLLFCNMLISLDNRPPELTAATPDNLPLNNAAETGQSVTGLTAAAMTTANLPDTCQPATDPAAASLTAKEVE